MHTASVRDCIRDASVPIDEILLFLSVAHVGNGIDEIISFNLGCREGISTRNPNVGKLEGPIGAVGAKCTF